MAALVQRRNAMMSAAAVQQSQSQQGYSLMNGSMQSMMQPGMVSQQRPVTNMSAMAMLRAQMPRTIGDMNSGGGVMGYSSSTATRNGQPGNGNVVDANQGMIAQDMMSASWQHQMKSQSTAALASQIESPTTQGMYSGMRQSAGPSVGRGAPQGFPGYFQ